MKQKAIKFLSVFLSLIMLLSTISTMPITTFAAETKATEEVNTYETKTSTLAPGITQDISYAYCADGAYLKYYVAVADLANPYVGVNVSYKDAQCEEPGMQKMTDQAAALNELHSNPDDEANYIPNYAVVAGVNGDGYNTSNGQPSGVHYSQGVVGFNKARPADSKDPWFAIFEDGTALCGANGTDWDEAIAAHGQPVEAIGGFQLVMKDSVEYEPGSTMAGSSYLDSGRYPRSFIGVTADNKVVIMAADGNNAGGSTGTDWAESVEIMKEAGCTYVLCLDGGGSATYISRPEGKNDIELTNIPSDGGEREVSNGIVFYTTVPASDTFDHAVINVNDAYIAPGVSTKVSAFGVSPAGTEAAIPEGAVWTATLGSVADGVFTAGNETGVARVSLMLEDTEIGFAEINVVHPTKLSFSSSKITLPYGKSTTLKVNATVNEGLNKVLLNDEDVVYTVSDDKLATVDGDTITANDGTSGVTQGTIKAEYVATGLSTSTTLELGRGSEIVHDFESDTTVSAYSMYNYGDTISSKIVTSENGQVRNGEKAMAISIDFTNYRYNGRGGLGLQNLGMNGLKDDVVSIGFWVYFPEDCVGFRAALRTFKSGSTAKADRATIDLFTVGDSTSAERPGWYYYSATMEDALLNENGFDLYQIHFYVEDYIPVEGFDPDTDLNTAGEYTFYIDDITIDYSAAVEDREVPNFDSVTYAVSGMSDAAALNGQTVNTNTVDIVAKVSDFAADNMVGLDYSTAKAFVDGVAVTDQLTVTEGTLSLADLFLTEGTHTFRFEICDNNGNPAGIERHITVDTENDEPAVSIEMKNPTNDKLLVGSVHYIDIKLADLANTKTLTTTLNLNGFNDWILDQMVVSKGFDVQYTYDSVVNDVTMTFTRNNTPVSANENVIASIPVRVYQMSDDCSTRWARELLISTEYGVIENSVGEVETFSMKPIQLVSEVWRSGEYHLNEDEFLDVHRHVKGTAVDKAATCTENGYTGAIFCVGCNCKEQDTYVCDHPESGCGSVLDWGTTIPATGHSYELDGEVLKCSGCGNTFTGIFTDDKEYADGVVLSGWVNDSYYVDGVKLTGVQLVDGYYYDFGGDGICAGQTQFTGLFYDESVSAYRYSKLGELVSGWIKIDDYWHYFDRTTMVAVTGDYYYASRNITYHFDETGKTEGTWQKTSEGTRFWYGEWYYTARNEYQRCFVEIDGKTYNFNTEGYLTIGIHPLYDDWVSTVNNTMTVWEFDENGALVRQISTPGTIDAHDGKYLIEEDGYVHTRNIRLVKFRGDIYFVNHSGRLAVDVNKDITSANSNGLLEPGSYYFGEDGKLFSTGIRKLEDGNLYYYENGKLGTRIYNSQLAEINGSIYLVKWSGKVAANEFREITAANSNGLLDAGTYFFGEDGKLYSGTGTVWNESEQLYYYCKDGKIGSRIYNNQLAEINGDIYFVKWSGKVAVNETREITVANSNGILEPGSYYFGEDGKLFTGVKLDADGNLYYYKDGELGNRIYNNQLAEINGSIYLVKWSGKVAVNETRVITTTNSNNILQPGSYYFGEDGKLFTGVMEDADGILCYYENGTLGTRIYNSELVKINGAIYLVKWSGKVAVNETREITSVKGNGLLTAGTYYFGVDGKLQE